MVTLTKTEIIDQLKRIGLDDPSEISPCVKTYKKYHISQHKSNKYFCIAKYFKMLQFYFFSYLLLMKIKVTCLVRDSNRNLF